MLKVLELFAGLQILVSSDGRVFSLPHCEKRANGRVDNRRGREIKPTTDKYGYKRVTFSHKNERHSYPIHRLVALAFIPNPDGKPTVNHKNGIKLDNRVENLEWATQKEQKRHSINNHLCDKNIEALKNANERASRKVNIAGKTYPSIRSASRELGISQWSVARKGVFYG
jgi:hypothetical protein